MTPVSREEPMGQPPRKWAVSGAPISSPTLQPAKPLMSAAIAEAASEAALICLGLGEPWPWRAVSRPLPTPSGFRYVVRELSSDCMTRPMMVFSDQRRLERGRRTSTGGRAAFPRPGLTPDGAPGDGPRGVDRPPPAVEALPQGTRAGGG